MSRNAVWIDERTKDRKARLKRAARRWALDDQVRGHVSYNNHRKLRRRKSAGQQLETGLFVMVVVLLYFLVLAS